MTRPARNSVGVCRLCGALGNLRNSHLIPASVYKELRGEREVGLVRIVDGFRVQTSKHVTAKLLCHGCEQLFNIRGERWTLGQMLHRDGSFRLNDYIREIAPVVTLPTGIKIFAGPAGVEAAVYFAASVFWRAAALVWPIGKRGSVSIDLGPYEPAVASYLLGGPFPDNVSIGIQVIENQLLATTAEFPAGGRDGKYWNYAFRIPGILFSLWAGARVEQTVRDVCAARTGRIGLYPVAEASKLQRLDKQIRTSVSP